MNVVQKQAEKFGATFGRGLQAFQQDDAANKGEIRVWVYLMDLREIQEFLFLCSTGSKVRRRKLKQYIKLFTSLFTDSYSFRSQPAGGLG